MSEPSVFTKIINGELPCHKVYEDEFAFAFMDIRPVQPGTVVVSLKQQIVNYEDVPEDLFAGFMLASQKIAKAQRKVFSNKKKMALRIEGLDVDHVHTVLFPIDNAAEFRAIPPEKEPNHDELEEIAEKLRKELS